MTHDETISHPIKSRKPPICALKTSSGLRVNTEVMVTAATPIIVVIENIFTPNEDVLRFSGSSKESNKKLIGLSAIKPPK